MTNHQIGIPKYRTIVIDPPYPQPMTGAFKSRHVRPKTLPYKTMTLADITLLPIEQYAELGCHLYLWTTNRFLRDSFDLMEAWGFTYLVTLTWVKPSGLGAWFANTTQHCLFGYYKKCQFNKKRWKPTHFNGIVKPGEHSKKPDSFYKLVEDISDSPKLEVFARENRLDYDSVGNEVNSSIIIPGLETQ